MNRLEQYIAQATKGLYGKKKLEIQAELRGSIEARIWQLELQGNQNALETALLEMGDARNISVGLIKEHLMPNVLKNAVLVGIFAIASISALTSSQAQIQVETVGQSLSTDKMSMYYLRFSSIKENLEAAGISVDDTPLAPVENSVAYSLATKPSLRFRFPDAKQDLVLQTAPGFDSPWKADAGELVFDPKPSASITNDRVYMNLWSFLHQLKKTGLPINVEGWRNPSLKVGKTTLQIGSEKLLVTPWQLYSSIASQAVQEGVSEFGGWLMVMEYNGIRNHAIRINAPAGTVYAIATPVNAQNPMGIKRIQYIDVARVGQDGILYFKTPHKVIEFVKSRTALQADFLNVNKVNYGSSNRAAKALLIRMNSDLTTIFEIPKQTRSAAIK